MVFDSESRAHLVSHAWIRRLGVAVARYPPYTPKKSAMIKKVITGDLVPPTVKKGGVALAAFALGAFIKSKL